MSDVLVTTIGAARDIRLARPAKKNAMTQAMYAACADALEAAHGDDGVAAVMLSGEVRIGQIYNGEAWMAEQANPKIRFVIPKEGPLLWVDNLVIPKSARHVEEAHAFIDFVLRPEIAKAIAEDVGYTTPNLAARALLAKKVRDNRTAYPADADLERGEFQTDVGDALPLYEQYWSKLKSAR